jgi:flagellar biogenesis protein FliO
VTECPGGKSRRHFTAFVIAMMVGVLLVVTIRSEAQTTRASQATQATQATQASADDGLIRRSPSSDTAASKSAATQKSAATSNPLDVRRILLALGIVLALICALKWLSKLFFSAAAGNRSSRAVQVLSRTVIGPKQQFMLVQVGKRIIVIGDSGNGMSPLAEITDPDEVATLVGQVQEEKGDSISKAFGGLFSRAKQKFEPAAEPNSTAGRSGGVRDASADDRDDDEGDESSPQLAFARQELGGLMDRVRSLSDQLRRP